jgi:hypothetical protein
LSSQLDQQIFLEHELVGAEMVLNPLRLARHILPPGLSTSTNIYACTISRHAGSIWYVCRQDLVCMEYVCRQDAVCMHTCCRPEDLSTYAQPLVYMRGGRASSI